MLRAYLYAAVVSLTIPCALTMPMAAGAPELKGPERISAPIWYEDLMLIVSNSDGVAVVIFKDDWNKNTKDTVNCGVHYQFRYLGRDAKAEVRGDGLVRENRRYKPTDDPTRFEVIDIEDRLIIEVGSLHIEWSYCTKGRGWIYYVPEKMSVQIGNANEFSRLELKRFLKR